MRRRRGGGELAFSAWVGLTGTSLLGLVRVTGTRWVVEEGFQQAKGEVGLDHDQVRRWPGWYRHVTSTPPGPRQARTLPATRAARLES